MAKRDNRWCLICQPKNRTLYWHASDEEKMAAAVAKGYEPDPFWCYCNKCDRAYSLSQYCEIAGIDKDLFIDGGDFHFQEAQPDEVNAMAWPSTFVPLSDPRAAKGVEYIKSRGLLLDGDMYYDLNEEGIVFPYYVENHFCGAQVRFIETRVNEDGDQWKITTLPGTRLGLLFYGWNQGKLLAQIKGIIVTEGAFNAISIQQALNNAYGGLSRCPWRAIACSGSGATEMQQKALKELKDKGYKIVIAPDTDEAGIKMYTKYVEAGAATHYTFTNDTEKDWNDLLKEMGHQNFAKFLIKSIKPIDDSKERPPGGD
jgi:hypothetical protein